MLQPTFSWRPAFLATPVVRPRVMSQAVPYAAPPPAVLAGAHLVGIAMGAATAWVGLDTGARRSGLLSILGYVIGVGGAISAVIDLGFLGVMGYRAIAPTRLVPSDLTTPLPPM